MGPSHGLPYRRASRTVAFAFLVSFSPALFSQTANQQAPVQVPSAPATSASPEKPAVPCTPLAENGVPIRSTIEARVNGVMESNHLKPGKKLWVNSVFEMDFPECRMAAGAPVYGKVIASSSSKNPNASELALSFDAVDCLKHEHQPMKLVLVGLIAAPEGGDNLHSAVPTEVGGSARQISDSVAGTSGYDANLSAALPSWVQPGYMAGFRTIRLEPQGGPGCSARLVSTERSIILPPGTVFLLAPLRSAQ